MDLGFDLLFLRHGCHLKCKYCHNRDTWDPNNGRFIEISELVSLILKYTNYIMPHGGVTITGRRTPIADRIPYSPISCIKRAGYSYSN